MNVAINAITIKALINEEGDTELWLNGQLIDIAVSQELIPHSRTFDWGYEGSGPAQSALAICLEIWSKPVMAMSLYQRFNTYFVVNWPRNRDVHVQIDLTEFIIDNRDLYGPMEQLIQALDELEESVGEDSEGQFLPILSTQGMSATEENVPYLLKIDPYTETVTKIEFSEKFSDLARWTGGRSIQFGAIQDNGDTVILNAESLTHRPYAPAWHLEDSVHLCFGTGLWVNVSPDGQLRTPLTSVRELVSQLCFLGFVEPQIEHVLLMQDEDNQPSTDGDDEPFGDDSDPDSAF